MRDITLKELRDALGDLDEILVRIRGYDGVDKKFRDFVQKKIAKSVNILMEVTATLDEEVTIRDLSSRCCSKS